jgi:hypothetical protein
MQVIAATSLSYSQIGIAVYVEVPPGKCRYVSPTKCVSEIKGCRALTL